MMRTLLIASLAALLAGGELRAAPARPNVLLILADDLGFSDLGCYGSEIATPHIDRLAAGGLRFTSFYNAARCCPTRASLLTGLYPHQAGVGHMLQAWSPPGYTTGLNDRCATIAEVLRLAKYRTYHAGKWHVGHLVGFQTTAHPLDRGFDRFYGTGGGSNYFAPKPLMSDRKLIEPKGPDYYLTDDLTGAAVRFVREHARDHAGTPFFLHLCYTAPHFPLQARPADIQKYRGKYRAGWDALRQARHARQKKLGIVESRWKLSPRDPVAAAWADAKDKDEWDLRMAVYAAMIDRMDQGIGRVLDALRAARLLDDTLILFLSDNGASAEALDTWPNPARGHKPGAVTGTRDSHRCLEVGWANAANTPFREHKMWVHEGGISTPLIAHWPAGIAARGKLTSAVGHIVDILPTLIELAGVKYPARLGRRDLVPLEGKSLVPILQGKAPQGERTLFWEHEGNRAIRDGKWKLVAEYRGKWELYDLESDRTECSNLAGKQPQRVQALAAKWQAWAKKVGVVPWEKLPGSKYKPSATYRKKSEPVAPKGKGG
jgi:arylsulfatase